MPEPAEEPPTAEPVGSDAEAQTGRSGAAKDAGEQQDGAPPPGYADFEPSTTPG